MPDEKPVLLYYNCLNWQGASLGLAAKWFSITPVNSPDEDSSLAADGLKPQVVCAPLQWPRGRILMGAFPGVKAVISNTTTESHLRELSGLPDAPRIFTLKRETEFLQSITSTAEHTLGLLMAAHRHLPAVQRAVAAGSWSRYVQPAPKMLSRSTLLVIGRGRVGGHLIRMTEPLFEKVTYFDEGMYRETLLTLLRQADFVAVTAALTPSSRGLLDAEALSALPRHAVVVNTARGEIMDLEALLDRLEVGAIRAAALDVLPGEFEPDFPKEFSASRAHSYVLKYKNLILTPHIAGSTLDAWSETEQLVIRRAAEYLRLC